MTRFFLALMCVQGCGLFSDEPYLIDELTIVAVIAEPPEIHAGEQTHLTAVIADPKSAGVLPGVAWSFCPERNATQNRDACDRPQALDARPTGWRFSSVAESAADHSIASEDIAHVSRVILQAGFWEHVQVEARTAEQEATAIKRVVVIADDFEPNTNPALWDVAILNNGKEIGADDPTSGTLVLRPNYDREGFEAYRVLRSDGAWEDRQESAVFTWYVTDGTLDRFVTRAGDEVVTWELPETDGGAREIQVFCVLRDGRGGTDVWAGRVMLASE